MIIITSRKSTKPISSSSSKYQGFTPHWNRAMDKQPVWVGSRRQYDYELKKRGLELHDPERKVVPKLKAHVVSQDTRKIANSIKSYSDKNGNFNPSGNLKKELIKRKIIRTRSEIEKFKSEAPQNTSSGGFK